MSSLNILRHIASVSGKNDKLQILKDNSSNQQLAELLDAVFNYNRRFWVNKFEMPEPITNTVDMHKPFLELLCVLETRKVTGNAAKTTVEKFFSTCDIEQQEWYAKILRKDIKAGFSAKTAVKAGFKSIPLFDVMLAKDGKTCKKAREIVEQGVFVTPKYDGYRCLALVDNGVVTLLSRNGTVYENFQIITNSLTKCFPKGQYVFDGEIMSDDFQSMQKSAFANKRGTTVGDVKYHIFGYVPYNEWITKNFKMNTMSRITELYKLAKSFDENLQVVKHTFVNSMDLVLKMEQQYLTQGYEGAMALPDIPYFLGKKSNKLLKFKTMMSEDCEIIGFYEGKLGTKYAGMLGGFKLKQENGKECECGSGFSDEDREYIWQHKEEFIHRLVEIKYQEMSNHGIMRFPIFMRYRDLDRESDKI